MISIVLVLIGVVLAGMLLAAVPRTSAPLLRAGAGVLALAVLGVFVTFSSVRFVGEDSVGIVVKNALGPSLKDGKVIAVDGEMGTQANVLAPGWHFGYWPLLYSVRNVSLTTVGPGEVGLIEALDGQPLESGQVFAGDFPLASFQDARGFLTDLNGQKGPQSTVLTPGKYRLNSDLFNVSTVPQLDVKAGSVAVLKSNVGADPSIELTGLGEGTETVYLAQNGEKGIRADPLQPGKYPINPNAFETYVVSTERRVAEYTQRGADRGDSRNPGAIAVKSSDGFNFPVDVRVVYYIRPSDAPKVVSLLGGDNEKLQMLLTSRVRSIFRDNAESVRALDYVQQRSKQAKDSTDLLRTAMAAFGVTIESIDIGEVGSEETLGELLKTQRDREIAVQEQLTFQEQQRAAEQQKALSRTQQEAEEEKRLATAEYQAQIAEVEKRQRIILAEGEAEAIRIRAVAEAEAYAAIAAEIGAANVATIELLKIVGERGISITPRVMVNGGGDSSSSADVQSTALIGTMLDTMVSRDAAANPTGRSQERKPDGE